MNVYLISIEIKFIPNVSKRFGFDFVFFFGKLNFFRYVKFNFTVMNVKIKFEFLFSIYCKLKFYFRVIIIFNFTKHKM